MEGLQAQGMQSRPRPQTSMSQLEAAKWRRESLAFRYISRKPPYIQTCFTVSSDGHSKLFLRPFGVLRPYLCRGK